MGRMGSEVAELPHTNVRLSATGARLQVLLHCQRHRTEDVFGRCDGCRYQRVVEGGSRCSQAWAICWAREHWDLSGPEPVLREVSLR